MTHPLTRYWLAIFRAVDQGILLLFRGPSREILEHDLRDQLERLVPLAVHVTLIGPDSRIPITEVIRKGEDARVVYYVREGEGGRQFQQAVPQGAGTVQISEVAQTEPLRTAHLRAKGALVVRCRQRSYQVEIGGGVQTIKVHEADLLAEACQKAGYRCVSVRDATAEEVELHPAEESVLLSHLLGLEGELKLVILGKSNDRVIRDYAGRLLNCANEEVKDIRGVLPDAVGNPVKRALLQIYMDIDNFRFDQARRQVKKLLLDPELHELAQLSTGSLSRDYLRQKLERLLTNNE